MAALAEIRTDADQTFPSWILDECGDALILFGAGFAGRQDGIWIAEAGLTATVVDIRPRLLHEMAAVYPPDWAFLQGDVFDFLERSELRTADLVSADPPSGSFDRCAQIIDQFCGLARRFVVLGCGRRTEIVPPAGWMLLQRIRRTAFAGGCDWALLAREAA